MVEKKPQGPADVINLRQARKSRERAAQAAQGDENRARHGQPKSQKTLAEARKEKAERELDAARRDRQEGDTSES